MSASPWCCNWSWAGTAGARWPSPHCSRLSSPPCFCAGTTATLPRLRLRSSRHPPPWRTRMLDSVLFYFFASIAVISAGLMVTRRNAIHSAVFLITTLLSTAGIFLQLRAEFLFIAQIILYVGGIMVLFIFVIMLVRLDVALHHIRFRMKNLVVTIVIAVLGAEAGAIIL